jgi:N-carbamoylputrescine amidase
MNKNPQTSRRRFIRDAAGGLVAAAALPAMTTTGPTRLTATTAGGLVQSDRGIEVTRDVFQRQEMLNQLVERYKKRIADGLKQPDARPVTVGVFQMRNHCAGAKGKEENLEHMLRAVKTAAAANVNVLVFPEMCLAGYFTALAGSVEQAIAANHSLADEVGSSGFLSRLERAAADARMVLSFGFCEKAGPDYFNSVGVIDADGRWLGARRKNPLYPYPYETRCFTEPDPSGRSTVLASRYGKLGISCCFDGEFPESVRQMRLEGAEILLWSNAALGDSVLGSSHRLNHSGSHAQANFMWVACVNCVAKNCRGTSAIYAPFGEPLVILSPDREALGVAEMNLRITEDWAIWRDRLDPRLRPRH